MTTQKINTRKHTPLPPPLGLNQCIYLNRLEKTLDSSLTAACVAAWFTCWRIPCGMLPYTWAAACIPADDPPPPGRLYIIIHTHTGCGSVHCVHCVDMIGLRSVYTHRITPVISRNIIQSIDRTNWTLLQAASDGPKLHPLILSQFSESVPQFLIESLAGSSFQPIIPIVPLNHNIASNVICNNNNFPSIPR